MAFTINQSQQIRSGAVYPISAYSRVVSVELAVADPWGWTYVVTPVVGDRVWLLGVKVWMQRVAVDLTQLTSFSIYAGGGRNSSLQDVITWENVLPKINNAGQMISWHQYDGSTGFEWDLSKKYEGDSRRFALVGTRTGLGGRLIQASFLIAEG